MNRYTISRRYVHYTILYFDELRAVCGPSTVQRTLKLVTDTPTLYRDFQYIYELRDVCDTTGDYFFEATPSAIEMVAHLLYLRQYIHFDMTIIKLIAYRSRLPQPYHKYLFDRIISQIPNVPDAIPLFDTHSEMIQKRIAGGCTLNELFES